MFTQNININCAAKRSSFARWIQFLEMLHESGQASSEAAVPNAAIKKNENTKKHQQKRKTRVEESGAERGEAKARSCSSTKFV